MACPDIISLRREEADEFLDYIYAFMYSRDPCDNDSDFCCRFCDKRPLKNNSEIEHDVNCFGRRAINLLS